MNKDCTSSTTTVNPLSFAHSGEIYFVRPADHSDIPALRRLVNAAYKELGDMGLNYTATYQDDFTTKERVSRGRAIVLLKGKGKCIVGTALFTVQNYLTNIHSGYVSQVAVEPALKRLGLGGILMDLCEELARAEKFQAVQLDTAKPAHHLVNWYLKRGYAIVGETRWEGKKYESWIFEKLLPNHARERSPGNRAYIANLVQAFSALNLMP